MVAEEWKASDNKIQGGPAIVHAPQVVTDCTLYMMKWMIVYQVTNAPQDVADNLGKLYDSLFVTKDVPDGNLGHRS